MLIDSQNINGGKTLRGVSPTLAFTDEKLEVQQGPKIAVVWNYIPFTAFYLINIHRPEERRWQE